MIVHHFTFAEFAIKALRDRRLKITRINELNDPLQFCAADFFDSDTQTKLETFKNQSSDQSGAVELLRNSFCWSGTFSN